MMTCTLDLYTDYLLSSTGPATATGLSRLLDGGLRHDHVTRWLRQTTYGPADIWRHAKPLIRQAEARRPADEFAVLLVDDSVLEKAHTDANELICTHWDHSQQRYVKGLNFVSLLYQAGELALPIAVELVRKTVPIYHPKTQQTSYQSPFTKNEYLQQMLRVAQQQVAYRYLLADSWYASAENMTLVRAPELIGSVRIGRFAGKKRNGANGIFSAGARPAPPAGPTVFAVRLVVDDVSGHCQRVHGAAKNGPVWP